MEVHAGGPSGNGFAFLIQGTDMFSATLPFSSPDLEGDGQSYGNHLATMRKPSEDPKAHQRKTKGLRVLDAMTEKPVKCQQTPISRVLGRWGDQSHLLMPKPLSSQVLHNLQQKAIFTDKMNNYFLN